MGNPKRTVRPFVFEIEEDHPQFVSAAARGIAILRCFEHGEQFLGNAEIARRTGLPKPTVSRLTFTLMTLGFLSYAEDREEYSLGVAVLSLGHNFVRCHPVIDAARPLMRRFAAETGSTVMLGAPDGLRMVVLEICAAACCPPLALETGARVPHGLTALGRADLAARPLEWFQRELQELRRECQPGDWPRVREGILQARTDVERRGFCMSLGEWFPDIYAVGVPMVAPNSNRVLSFSCGGHVAETTRERLVNELGPKLVALRDAVVTATRGQF